MSISVVLAAIVGFLAARMLWLAVRNSWTVPALLRRNYRGMQLPTAAGIIIPLALLLVEGLRAIFGAIGIGEDGGFSPVRGAALIIVVGFATLGLLDDLLGNSTKAKGLAGHVKALRQGEFTTGSLKLLGGIALALVAAAMVNTDNIGALIVDGAVIALAANLGNLLDLRPGRTTKISVIAFVIMAIVSGLDSSLIPVAIAVGAAVALFLDEMHERLMLGDTGANALGAMLGLGIVTTTGTSGALIAAVVLVLLTVVGDTVGFTKIFDKVAPLRAFDALGRKSTNSQSSAASFNERITAQAAPAPQAQQQPEPEATYEPAVSDVEIDLNQYEDEYEDEELSLDEIEDDELEPEPVTRSTIDVREEPVAQVPAARVVPPSPPRSGMASPSSSSASPSGSSESNTRETPTTLSSGNAGATASSFTSREPRPFSSPRTGEVSPTRGRYDDEFEDTPDFFTPRRPSQPQSRPGNENVEQRPLSDRFHSPFDDDEEEF